MCLAENLNFPQPSILSQLHQQVQLNCKKSKIKDDYRLNKV